MAKADARTLGNRIRIRRKKLGLSQNALAEILHCPQQTIDGWEHGKAARPRLLLEASIALCTTQEWLLRGDGPEEVEPALSVADVKKMVDSLDRRLLPAALELLKNLGCPRNSDAA